MGLFKKKKTDIEPAAVAQETVQTPQAVRQAQKAALTSGRMAALYQRLYQWIFSVNITANVYQIESGEDTFAKAPLPIRGYYTDLLARMEAEILPDMREDFNAMFHPDSLLRAVESDKTSIRGAFAAKELGAVYEEETEEAPVKWYEFSAEWLQDVNRNNIVLVFSVRHINGDLDTGKHSAIKQELTYYANGDIDWTMTRAKHFDQAYEGMNFEYDVAEDCMYLHRTRGNSDGDRVTKRYVATLSSHADFEVSHDSISTVKNLLRKRDIGVEQAIILFRKGGVYGAPFHRYRVTTAPLEEGTNSWIIGRMEDVEAEMARSDSNKALASELNNMMQFFHMSMYQIDTTQGLIWNIEQDENGFRRQENPQRLEEYIKKRIDSNRIAPESQDEYLKWLEKGYLQRKTLQGPYEYEAHVKDMGDLDFRWYTETIVAVKDKPGQFVRWRKDDTEGHCAREAEYKNKELIHITQYNGQMLDTMASLVEFRSVESSNHIARVRALTQIMLEDIKTRSPQYELTNKEINMYIQASTMHDIGKIAVPDYILNKEGRYTPEEFAIMKKHTTDGAAIIDRLNMPGQEKTKACIRDVVLHHHERYDGNGYPDHLKGDEIKIGVQAVSLADVYDALVSERCYKKSYAFSEAMHMILDGQCGVFNPRLLESLKACEEKLRTIYEKDEEIRLKSE